MKTRRFPLMCPHRIELEVARKQRRPALSSIPWALIEPHEAQALKNHCDQSLEHLAKRGGLGYHEAIAVIAGVSYRDVAALSDTSAEAILRKLCKVWKQGS